MAPLNSASDGYGDFSNVAEGKTEKTDKGGSVSASTRYDDSKLVNKPGQGQKVSILFKLACAANCLIY